MSGKPDNWNSLTAEEKRKLRFDAWINAEHVKFDSSEVVVALQLNELDKGSLVELVVSGILLDGTTFAARDCIQLQK